MEKQGSKQISSISTNDESDSSPVKNDIKALETQLKLVKIIFLYEPGLENRRKFEVENRINQSQIRRGIRPFSREQHFKS
jgi:hypothetical protein